MSIVGFFKGVKKEANRTTWPNGKKLVSYSVITVSMLVFFGVFFFALDALFAFIRGLFS